MGGAGWPDLDADDAQPRGRLPGFEQCFRRTGNYLGFGFPGSSSSANRQFQEPMFGYYYTFWRNPKYGALQIVTQYAYLTRAPWYAAPGTPSTAHAHMFFGSLCFTLP